MQIEKLNQWLTLGANLGVLVGIVFLSLEIDQSNRIAIGTAEYEMLRDINESNRIVMTNASVRDLIVKLADQQQELTELERQQAIAYAYNYYAVWAGVQSAHNQGLVSDEYLESALIDVNAIISTRPNWKFAWELILSRGYGNSDVIRAIENAISDL